MANLRRVIREELLPDLSPEYPPGIGSVPSNDKIYNLFIIVKAKGEGGSKKE